MMNHAHLLDVCKANGRVFADIGAAGYFAYRDKKNDILQQPIPPTSHYQHMLRGMGPIVIKAAVFLNAEARTILLDLAGPLTGLRILC